MVASFSSLYVTVAATHQLLHFLSQHQEVGILMAPVPTQAPWW